MKFFYEEFSSIPTSMSGKLIAAGVVVIGIDVCAIPRGIMNLHLLKIFEKRRHRITMPILTMERIYPVIKEGIGN